MTDPKEFFDAYCDFVTKQTSDPSLDIESLKASLENIQNNSEIDVPRLMTAALGLSSEGGEFVEIVKKMFLQGKPANEENIFHMKRELGDIMWYVAQACLALNVDLTDVIKGNKDKLSKRFPQHQFSVAQDNDSFSAG